MRRTKLAANSSCTKRADIYTNTFHGFPESGDKCLRRLKRNDATCNAIRGSQAIALQSPAGQESPPPQPSPTRAGGSLNRASGHEILAFPRNKKDERAS